MNGTVPRAAAAHQKYIGFVISLLQDVNVLRPVALLAAAEFDARIIFLVADEFNARDGKGVWIAEVHRLAQMIAAEVHIFGATIDAYRLLQGKQGVLIAGSESSLSPHRQTHTLFRAAPPGFLRVTLQHGYECVGFLQNREQTASFGDNVGFAADVACAWMDGDRLQMAPTERAKLYVTGPPVAMARVPRDADTTSRGGLVCENLHSVRFAGDVGRRASFMEDFEAFCAELARLGRTITLRPHPGGQYVLRNNVPLPAGVELENRPMYDIDLSRFDYGISAPSSVLIDLMLADVPIAVWHSPNGGIDITNYRGLPTIADLADWLRFYRAALRDRTDMIVRQRAFLTGLGMPLDPSDVRRRYARLLAGAGTPIAIRSATPRRILLVANAMIPTLEIFFLRPLRSLQECGAVEISCLTETYLRERFEKPNAPAAADWIDEMLHALKPDLVIFCRYSGPQTDHIIKTAQKIGARSIYHLDDDLLNVPIELGAEKHRFHNAPARLNSVSTGLAGADLVYASNPRLLSGLGEIAQDGRAVAGAISSSAEIRRLPTYGSRRKFGYMGFDHSHDLDVILPAIIDLLDGDDTLRFELFGSIPKPPALDRFADRVTTRPPVRGYSAFQAAFAAVDWDVGICPLADTDFNRLKVDVKWVEYTSVGIAVVATGGTIYDACCADGCGMLATTTDDWIGAVRRLCTDADVRVAQVESAQRRLVDHYSLDALRRQTLEIFDRALGEPFLKEAAAGNAHALHGDRFAS